MPQGGSSCVADGPDAVCFSSVTKGDGGLHFFHFVAWCSHGQRGVCFQTRFKEPPKALLRGRMKTNAALWSYWGTVTLDREQAKETRWLIHAASFRGTELKGICATLTLFFSFEWMKWEWLEWQSVYVAEHVGALCWFPESCVKNVRGILLQQNVGGTRGLRIGREHLRINDF